jgi:hypothetical protein
MDLFSLFSFSKPVARRRAPSRPDRSRDSNRASSRGSTRPRLPRGAPGRPFEALEPRALLSATGVTYQGGPLINNVAVETVFLGQEWSTDPTLHSNAYQLDQFFNYLTNSSYMDMLHEYSTPQAGQIGRGSFAGGVVLPEDDWRRGMIADQTIENILNNEIVAGNIAPPDSNRLLFVFTPPNVAVTQGGSSSDGFPEGFAGYHNSFVDSAGGLVRYAVIPDPIGNDQGSLSVFDQQTSASSHEMAEAVTDPDGTSWWDDSNDAQSGEEIGDFADLNTNTVYLGGYAVERLWSNQFGGLEAPAGFSPTPTPISTGGITPPASGGQTSGGQTSGGNSNADELPPNLASVAMSLTHDTNSEASFVAGIYQEYVGRAPDLAGLDYWIGRMKSSMTDEQVEAAFTSTPEYVQVHGPSDTGWVSAMYQDVLGRAADAAGLQYWTSQLQAGVSHYQVALGLADSAEHEALVIGNDYQTFLGRSASPQDVSYWVSRFEQGATNEQLLASFLASAEYYNNPAKGQADRIAWIDSAFQDLYGRAPSGYETTEWLAELG